MKIAIVAPACPLDPALADAVQTLARDHYGSDAPELAFHPQCFLTAGHFAGPDEARLEALVDVANDASVDTVWFARGGYGSNRIAETAVSKMGKNARAKVFLGYSDMGFVLAALTRRGIGRPVHGPMPSDLKREGGSAAVLRSLDWLVRRTDEALEPSSAAGPRMAFNLTVLGALLGTPLEPDFTGVELLIEDVDEMHYALDRTLFRVTSSTNVRKVRGIRMGRFAVPENDRPFGAETEDIIRDWCGRSGIPFLGHADIGHDAGNRIVAFPAPA